MADFPIRFQANDTGNIIFASNTLMTAPPEDPDARNAQNGIGKRINNNDFNMVYVNIDGDPSTFNSSSAELLLPAGAQVLFAGLYWGSKTQGNTQNASTSLRNRVKFKPPGSLLYLDLVGSVIGSNGEDYQGFKDVTAIVQSAGSGTYTTANVQARRGTTNLYGGWSLVVAYRAAGEPARNLTVFDGYTVVSNNQDQVINISGFKAPTSGPVKAMLGFVTYEGDLGLVGDQVLFNGQVLSDAANSPNNFFNSTISYLGSLVSTKDPDYVNQLGFDANIVAANNIIENGATSARIRMTSSGDQYFPGVITSAIELFAPKIEVTKTVENLSGDPITPGDILRYTIVVENDPTALDNAANVILQDLIPNNTTYNPGTLTIDGVPKTDAPGDDQAEVIPNGVQFQLGSGATATAGGTLTAGQSTVATFEVVVGAIPSSTVILNVATVNYTGEVSGFDLTATDSVGVSTLPAADISVTKTALHNTYTPPMTNVYTIVVTNNGPSDAVGIKVQDIIPSQAKGASWTASYSLGSGPAEGNGDIDVLINLLNTGTATFTLRMPIRADSFGNIENVVTVTPPDGLPDPDLSNNTATHITRLELPDLRLRKQVQNLNGSSMVSNGDTLRYTITISNLPDPPSEPLTQISLKDVIPAFTKYVVGSLRYKSGVRPTTLTEPISKDGINVRYDSLDPGENSTITFDVVVDVSAPGTVVIANQSRAVAIGLRSGQKLFVDASASVVTSTSDILLVQMTADHDGCLSAGDIVRYTVTATNLSENPINSIANVVLSNAIPENATFADNLSFTQGNIIGDNRGVRGNLGTLLQGQSASVSYDLRINNLIPAGADIVNCATITGTTKADLPLSISAPYSLRACGGEPFNTTDVILAKSLFDWTVSQSRHNVTLRLVNEDESDLDLEG